MSVCANLRTEQNRTEQNRTEQNRTEQNRHNYIHFRKNNMYIKAYSAL